MSKKLVATLCAFLTVVTSTFSLPANISEKQARKAIARLAGFNLSEKSIDIDAIETTSDLAKAGRANVSAEVEVVFRAASKNETEWTIKEVRTGSGNWEDVTSIAKALNASPSTGSGCSNTAPTKLTGAAAKCLVATLLGIPAPFEGIRIKDLSQFTLPIGSESSTVIVSLLRVSFVLAMQNGEWTVSDLKCAGGPQVSVEGLQESLNNIKREQARNELKTLSQALKEFHRERGIFVVSDKAAVLIDHLSPRFLHTILRFDPWHNPYQYRGDVSSYSISSAGPDGKPNTQDDLVVTNHALPNL